MSSYLLRTSFKLFKSKSLDLIVDDGLNRLLDNSVGGQPGPLEWFLDNSTAAALICLTRSDQTSLDTLIETDVEQRGWDI